MTDPRIQLVAVVALALAGLATIVGGIVLATQDKTLPGELIAIGSGAVGAIGGLVAAGRSEG